MNSTNLNTQSMSDPFFIIVIIHYELRNVLTTFCEWYSNINNNKNNNNSIKFNTYYHLNMTTLEEFSV